MDPNSDTWDTLDSDTDTTNSFMDNMPRGTLSPQQTAFAQIDSAGYEPAVQVVAGGGKNIRSSSYREPADAAAVPRSWGAAAGSGHKDLVVPMRPGADRLGN